MCQKKSYHLAGVIQDNSLHYYYKSNWIHYPEHSNHNQFRRVHFPNWSYQESNPESPYPAPVGQSVGPPKSLYLVQISMNIDVTVLSLNYQTLIGLVWNELTPNSTVIIKILSIKLEIHSQKFKLQILLY